jgi:hypothetical protein
VEKAENAYELRKSGLTPNTYSHVLPQADHEAADRIAALVAV